MTGLPSTASAIPANAQFATVTLLSQSTGEASVKNDGTDTTVRLQAAAPATVGSVTFSYTIAGGTPQTITTVAARNDDGTFSFEWTVPAAIVGASVTLTVSGTPSGGVAQTDTQLVDINAAGAPVESVNLSTASAAGVFAVPGGGPQNVIVPGTTSNTSGTVTINRRDQAGVVTHTTDATIEAPTGATTGTFRGVLDITGYQFGGTNELVLEAVNGSDDVESYTLYNQVITTVEAVAEDAQVPAGQSTDVTVTVEDQNGNPIAGADVRDGNGNFIDTTDENGQVETTQGAGTTFYYANADALPAFSATAGDKRSADVTVGSFAPVATAFTATSADGAAFDRDENALGDIVVQLRNQNGGPIAAPAGQTVQYYWQITPFDGSAPVRVPAGTATTPATENASATPGDYNVVLPAGEKSGSYELFVSLTDNVGTPADDGIDAASVLTVKVGDAAITTTPAGDQNAAPGGEVSVTGKVALEDGTGLPGRTVTADFTQGTIGTDTAKDAGLVLTGGGVGANRTYTTGADGTFTAVIDDPAETPQGSEVGGEVVFDTTFTDATAPKGVDFPLAGVPTGAVTNVVITDTTGKPGEVEGGTVEVDADPNTAGVQAVPGVAVTLTIDEGYFTDGEESPTPVVGQDAGGFTDLGQEITVVTDAAGQATFQIAIARNEGFDDDGQVTGTVTANGDSDTITWDSSNPLNGGEVQLVLAPEAEQDGPTDPAPTGSDVEYDVYTTDQFGNRVGGETVDLTEDGDDADLSTMSVQSDFDDDGDFSISSSEDDEVTITATWNAPFTEYTNVAGATTSGFRDLTDTVEQVFADFDLAAADITLTGNPETQQIVNRAVLETLTVVDEFGNPVQGLQVTFTRTGPGVVSESVTRFTNANGVAQYAFVGGAAGTATILAEVTDGSQVQTVTDTVTFVPDEPTRVPVDVNVGGRNQNARTDRVVVRTDPAAPNAVVQLFRKGNNGLVRVGVKRLTRVGFAAFQVRDVNGNRATKYIARVGETRTTLRSRGNGRVN
ncbi:hypothetical protein GCM10023226_43400 [Nocardioides nanhaiensis]|uniref:Big-1 domain-containing protein n=1 Tax=Nocardioides nanhaiensis TaxID=1476871 RepID=A0ABP8X2Z6_9ACTN